MVKQSKRRVGELELKRKLCRIMSNYCRNYGQEEDQLTKGWGDCQLPNRMWISHIVDTAAMAGSLITHWLIKSRYMGGDTAPANPKDRQVNCG